MNRIDKEFLKLENIFIRIFCKKCIVSKIQIYINKLEKMQNDRERLATIMDLSKKTEEIDLEIREKIKQYNEHLSTYCKKKSDSELIDLS